MSTVKHGGLTVTSEERVDVNKAAAASDTRSLRATQDRMGLESLAQFCMAA